MTMTAESSSRGFPANAPYHITNEITFNKLDSISSSPFEEAFVITALLQLVPVTGMRNSPLFINTRHASLTSSSCPSNASSMESSMLSCLCGWGHTIQSPVLLPTIHLTCAKSFAFHSTNLESAKPGLDLIRRDANLAEPRSSQYQV